MIQPIPIRLSSLNTELGAIRAFGRASTLQNVDIRKTNEVSRRKGFVRRLEAQQAGPIRLIHSFPGICGRFPNYADGGGLLFVVGDSYWPPAFFVADYSSPLLTLSWQYQDADGPTTTLPRGCTGVKVYKSTEGYASAFDTGELVYEGSDTSCTDDNFDADTLVYYTCYTTWEDNDLIVDPMLVMAWAYYLPPGEEPPDYPDPPAFYAPGPVADSGGSWLVANGIQIERDEVEAEEADVSASDFSDSATLADIHNVELVWVFNGEAKYNSGYTAIYRSTESGTGTKGTLVHRATGLTGETSDTALEEFTSDTYYTFVHVVEGVTVLAIEKTVGQNFSEAFDDNANGWNLSSGSSIAAGALTQAAPGDWARNSHFTRQADDGLQITANINSAVGIDVGESVTLSVGCYSAGTTSWLLGVRCYLYLIDGASNYTWNLTIFNASGDLAASADQAATGASLPLEINGAGNGLIVLTYKDGVMTATWGGVTVSANVTLPSTGGYSALLVGGTDSNPAVVTDAFTFGAV